MTPESPRESKAPAAAPSATAAGTSPSNSANTQAPATSPGPRASLDISDDFVPAKLSATRDWLRETGNRGFTIQLTLAADDPDELKRYLGAMGKFIETDQLYVYRTRLQNKPYLGVVYGEFPTRQAAQVALRELPEAVRMDRPYVRSRASIRDESPQAP